MLNLHQIVGRPWAVMPELAEAAQRVLEAEGFAGLRRGLELHAAFDREDREEREKRAAAGGGGQSKGAIALIPVLGLMTQRGGEVNSMDTVSTARVAASVLNAAAEPSVDGIVLEIDSPGGEVYGMAEAAAAVREARAAKPVVAVANSLAASAAYWLGAQAEELLVTTSGEVGSIGVFTAHEDVSGAMEKRGIKVTMIHAGKYKVEGHPYAALEDEARAEIQAGVDRYYDMFVRDVAKGRGVSVETVRKDFGEGRTLGAKEAVTRGMATAVGTLSDGIRRVSALAAERRRASSSVAQAQAQRYRRERA